MIDILGFGQMIKNLSPADSDKKITKWIGIVKKICGELNIKNYQLISDTLFIGVGKNKSDLNTLVEASRQLLSTCIAASIPIRGAISFGDYTWSSDLVYGKAVILAHELEMNQEWVGISCTSGIAIPEHCENLICYAIPFKNGPNRMGAVVVWDVPSYEELVRYLSKGGLAKSDEPLTAEWFSRVEKTILFSMYIKIAKKMEWSNLTFGGFSPLHSISKYFEEIL